VEADDGTVVGFVLPTGGSLDTDGELVMITGEVDKASVKSSIEVSVVTGIDVEGTNPGLRATEGVITSCVATEAFPSPDFCNKAFASTELEFFEELLGEHLTNINRKKITY